MTSAFGSASRPLRTIRAERKSATWISADQRGERRVKPARPSDGWLVAQAGKELVRRPSDPTVSRGELDDCTPERADADDWMVWRGSIPHQDPYLAPWSAQVGCIPGVAEIPPDVERWRPVNSQTASGSTTCTYGSTTLRSDSDAVRPTGTLRCVAETLSEFPAVSHHREDGVPLPVVQVPALNLSRGAKWRTDGWQS